VLMDAHGLIICSSEHVGGIPAAMQRMAQARGITATPTDLKVLIGDDTEGVEAKLLSRDSELDLAWIQIKQPSASGYAFIDFAKSREPQLDERLLSIRRMGPYFDRHTVFGESRLAGVVRKPRRLFVPTEA